MFPHGFTRAALVAVALAGLSAGNARAADGPRTLVLPFRTIGVSDTTAAVFGSLLTGELETHGVAVIAGSAIPDGVVSGASACDEAGCAQALAQRAGADRVVYGSLSRLGDKIIVRVRALMTAESTPSYSDQLSALREDDLDMVARRIGETLVAGRADADKATVRSVTLQDTVEPRRRASRAGVGFRTGFLFPDGDSYGGADRLTSLRLSFRYEAQQMFIETTPVIGFQWGKENFEWTLLDLTAGKMFGVGDYSPYIAGGLGVHAVHAARKVSYPYTDYYGTTTYYDSYVTQNETTLAADIGVGMMALRTYDFSILIDLRYHIVFSSFDQIGGDGAHGISLTFGTTR